MSVAIWPQRMDFLSSCHEDISIQAIAKDNNFCGTLLGQDCLLLTRHILIRRKNLSTSWFSKNSIHVIVRDGKHLNKNSFYLWKFRLPILCDEMCRRTEIKIQISTQKNRLMSQIRSMKIFGYFLLTFCLKKTFPYQRKMKNVLLVLSKKIDFGFKIEIRCQGEDWLEIFIFLENMNLFLKKCTIQEYITNLKSINVLLSY